MKLRNTTATAINQESRNEAILQNLGLVNNLARRLQSRVPPCVTFDDLTSAGTIGLIQAVDRFDQTRGLEFKTYAQHRVWGAMQDFLRGEDPLSRTERHRVRESVPGLSANECAAPATISLDQISQRSLSARTQPAFTLRSEVREARRCLSARENRVIALLYDFDWQSREVATELHVTESRVSQIKQRAISKLRCHLESVSATRAA